MKVRSERNIQMIQTKLEQMFAKSAEILKKKKKSILPNLKILTGEGEIIAIYSMCK